MAKIFCGNKVYEVSNANEACEVMNKITRSARGTFEGCSCVETGFYVDADDTVNLGEGRKLYRIKGSSDDKVYAETDSLELFK